MSGPPPKPAHLRQRTNKKAGSTVLELVPGAVGKRKIPEIPNPDGREWHPFTLLQWANAWRSPMASQWLDSDFDGLARLAWLWDDYNRTHGLDYIKEIRLQSAAFGLTPLDRSRLQWEVLKTNDAEERAKRRQPVHRTGTNDPRSVLTAVK
jgi:hypothetical protein